jgi:hypothetical protein
MTPESISVFPDNDVEENMWSVHREYGEQIPEMIPLLEAPRGWKVSESSLARLQPETTYNVAVYGDRANAVPIPFTLEVLAALPPGQVLVDEGPSGWKAVSEREFRSQARKECD